MTDGYVNSQIESKQTRIFRKGLIMPAEHGSWSWLLVPFGVGAGVAGQFNLPLLLTLTAGLAMFFMRQPATVWLRVRRGRARRSDGPIAAGWVVALCLIAVVSLVGLLALGRTIVLWLAGPMVGILSLYLIAARYGRAGQRSLWMELAGAAALAMMAPAALLVADGQHGRQVWVLWGIMAAQNALGALYVRLRIHDTHGRQINRSFILWGHVVGFVAVLLAGLVTEAPLAAALPFIAFLVRATWAVSSPHPVNNVKRFGFTEMGVEIVAGIWIAASYWFGR